MLLRAPQLALDWLPLGASRWPHALLLSPLAAPQLYLPPVCPASTLQALFFCPEHVRLFPELVPFPASSSPATFCVPTFFAEHCAPCGGGLRNTCQLVCRPTLHPASHALPPFPFGVRFNLRNATRLFFFPCLRLFPPLSCPFASPSAHPLLPQDLQLWGLSATQLLSYTGEV